MHQNLVLCGNGLTLQYRSVIIDCYLQECIKPVKIDRKPGKVGKIQIEDDGSYLNVSEVITLTKKKKKKMITGTNIQQQI